ncbi:MAG: hypothetical protein UY72_C0059G0007 [Candidatus Uhrbacteria bacterium GW2011_GWD2_52_7]|uniref:Phospholipid/glycerol acyltransferase domain-containing protein n=1 Tax=Candidatus Uhrbacteria bacterium GW2011_GWD2_52_7 TaxID=1618989 RepID=A0A0G1XDC7_9BACT|nr:MAG: hypothetical protein UY72_C0059G0007 [Candidatus Uhrbacteria bacterium GW2011_GWD2_52_7]
MTHVLKAWRTALLPFCFVLYAIVVLGVLLLAALARTRLFPRVWLRHAPYQACKLISVTAHIGLMGMKTKVDARLRPFRHDERIVVIANHPSLAAAPLFAGILGDLLKRELVFVGKKEHLRNPFVGWPLKLLDAAIFIDRSDGEAAINELMRELPRYFARGAVVVMLPDQYRLTQEKLLADQHKFREHGIDTHLFEHTLVPRTGGLRQILLAAGANARVIDVTAGCSCREFGNDDIPKMPGSTYHFHAEDVPHGLPTDKHELGLRLVRRWVTKNRLLGGWKTA